MPEIKTVYGYGYRYQQGELKFVKMIEIKSKRISQDDFMGLIEKGITVFSTQDLE